MPATQSEATGRAHSDGDIVVLDGVIDRITYVNEENGYTVARLKVPRQKQLTTIAGFMPAITVGEGLRLEGHWQNHPQYGRQLMVVRYQSAAPGTLASLKKYLGSGLLKGVGPTMAEHIVNTFGLETLHVLDSEPHRLVEVPGLGAKRAQAIAAIWAERRTLRDLMAFLQDYGLPVALAVRILRKYGTAAEAIVRGQPYRLAAEVYGITFEVADSMAARAGVPRDSLQRIGAGVATVLGQAAGAGHVFMPVEGMLTRASALLSLPREKLVEALPRLADSGVVHLEHPVGAPGPVAYPPDLHAAEHAVAEALARLQFGRDRLGGTRQQDWETIWTYLSRADAFELTREQREAVRIALTHRVSVITGGPGTGKTTTLRSIVRLVQTRGGTVVLAAPTGRAARRLTEAAGAPASTIHKLLELRPGGAYEVRAPLDADVVIIDEASMMDLQLAAALLGAVPAGAHLVLVGDADQLPPVGPGSVLRDVIDSRTVPVCRLQTIFRQPEGSAIVSNAHRINQGEAPVYGRSITDFYLFRQPNPAEAAALIVDLVSQRVPAKFGLDPMEDIQVLAPMYAGVCGVDALNANLQAVLNPPDSLKDERRYGNHIFRVGDRVMQVVNDYDRQVANGEVGRITRIDLEDQSLHVAFESGWTAEYSFQELDELTHAYAISVHKAQGSEYPCVIMPVLHQHERLLRRNLVYTAISRARQLVVLVGSPDTLADAVANDGGRKRHSGLVARLREAAT
ncbi:MAG TPA: ATP-dependent RecD-like DNA helicase [Chloroflexia bacterium]|nr:ATP-dependent RecD-like DNA helicase [Chloroflexia bacterium]